jgi:hypothetical protein
MASRKFFALSSLLLCLWQVFFANTHAWAKAEPLAAQVDHKKINCTDFLNALNKKPLHLTYVGCTQEVQQGADVLEAKYTVTGKHASKVEAYFMKISGMPKIRRVCCIWESLSASNAKRVTTHGIIRSGKLRYEISMSSDTTIADRSGWYKVPHFDVSVTLYRDSL